MKASLYVEMSSYGYKPQPKSYPARDELDARSQYRALKAIADASNGTMVIKVAKVFVDKKALVII